MGKINGAIHIAVAETSVILRSGIIATLKRLPKLKIHIAEIISNDALGDCMRMHGPDILIINPTFGDFFDVDAFKKEHPTVKCIAFVSSFINNNQIKSYDAELTVFDSLNDIATKIKDVIHQEENTEPENSNQESLSDREKEIVICVVKGLTNKEIASELFLSIHTVITHRRNITRKLQIHSPAGLTIYAIVNKLIDLKDVKQQ